MKIFKRFCVLIGALLILSALTVPVMAVETDQSVVNGCHSVDASVSLSDSEQLAETAKAVILYERNSDTLLYSWNPDERIYPSSMVKLMTALVAYEEGDLAQEVVVTKRALSYVEIGSVSANLKSGERLPLKDLMYCMMVASANDAATVIAEHVGGTQDRFIELMNRKAAALGCTDTHFSNVHGLHAEDTYTTARDICRIVDAALDIPVLKEMFCLETYTVPATNKTEEPREIWTTNYMMSSHSIKKYYDARVTGGKTGATDEAGRCLVATSEGKGMEILSIVMGAEPEYEENGLALKRFGSFEETAVLLDYAYANYEYRQIFYEGQAISQFSVENGTNSVIARPAISASTVLPAGIKADKLTWIFGNSNPTFSAPVEKGQVLSNVQVWYGSKCLAQTDLIAMNAVPLKQTEQEQDDPVVEKEEQKTGGIPQWVVIVACVLVGIVVLVMGLRVFSKFLRQAKQNARRRRRRNDRQRSR